ncbi:MAG: EAL domain-containing protein [Solobacterium sp.]|nr:EAL domain-containing protein [Solobacterium sp.]
MKSIRVKITAITIAAILTSILSVFAACYSTIVKENDRRSAEIMDLQLDNTQLNLERYFESVEKSVEMAANIASDSLDSVVLIECNAAGKSALLNERSEEQEVMLDEYLREYCGNLQKSFASVAAHTYGVITYYYCLNPEVSTNVHGFFYSRAGKAGFDEQPPLDARELDPNDMAHTTWYYTPIQRGYPSWVGPYTAHFLNEMWICSYLVPIYKSGTLIGVLGMDIPMDTLVDQVSQIRIYKSGYACLIDPYGKVFYHPDVPIGTEAEFLVDDNGESILSEEGDEMHQLRYRSNGQDMRLAYCTLSNGLRLVLVVPSNEINSTWTRFTRIILLSTVLVILVYSVAVSFIMSILTRPLQDLTAASRRLANGDYDAKLDYKGKDEVGELTDSFAQMRDQLKLYIDDLNHQIYTDALTELPNMRRFFDLAEAENKRLAEEGKPSVMLFFNLIGMKHYNRQFGFDEGDRLIREFADILRRHYGKERLGRFAQDHFAAVTEEDHLEKNLKEIIARLRVANNGNSLPVRIGIYPMRLEPVGADVACDRAKYACDQHRSSYESGFYYFTHIMLKQVENMRYIISHFDQALEEKWVKVCYQPIIRSETGKVCDEEALSRWIDPELGLLSPADFIPVLEDARLIYKLDLYVLDQVLEKMKSGSAPGYRLIPQSVNLSRSDFDACDMVEEIRRRVDEAGIERRLISIEITESIIGSDFEFMKREIERFRSLGFRVWMDDFGSGYSSLDVLQSLQFDLIKFDMSFMRRLDQGENSRIILTELMKMARELGASTLCEGVETESQVQFLKQIGCDRMQGYYYAKPNSMEEIAELVKRGDTIPLETPEETRMFEERLEHQKGIFEKGETEE